MLCTSEDPPGADFQPFRSANNAYRGRFHRVITLNSPHNGSTLLRYLLDLRNQGYLVTSVIRLFGDLVQNKFDPFGFQFQRIKNHWQPDPSAKFHLIATSIHNGDPPAVGDGLPLCYAETGLAGRVTGQSYSRGTIVIPSGSDGVVDYTSEYAGSLSNKASSIQGDISHSPPTWVFGVSVGNTATTNAAAGDLVANLFNGSAGEFGPLYLQPIDPALQAQIDGIVPSVHVNGNLIQLFHPTRPSHRMKNDSSATVYQYRLLPQADQEPAGPPSWYVHVFGPNGVTTDGVSLMSDENDPEIVSVTVDPIM